MKYLMKSADFTYDAATSKFKLALSEKLRTNRSIRMVNVSFQLRTDIQNPPHCLILCSNLAKEASSTVYQSAGQNHFQDLIGLLVENQPGRYVLRDPIPIDIRNKDISDINFWIRTEDGAVLQLGVGESQPGQAPSVSKSDVLDVAGLRIFLSHDVNQDSSYTVQNTVGSSVRYLMNEKPGENYLWNGYQDFNLAAWGQWKGVNSDESWNFAADSTAPNRLNDSNFTMIMGVKTPTTLWTTESKIFNFGYIKMRFGTTGVIRLMGRANSFDAIPNITLQPAKDYILRIRQVPDGQGGTGKQYEVKAIYLVDDSEQSGDMLAWTAGENPDQNQFACYFSDASQHFMQQTGILAPFILFEGSDEASETKCINWIKGVYNDGVYQAPSGDNSSFAIEVDV